MILKLPFGTLEVPSFAAYTSDGQGTILHTKDGKELRIDAHVDAVHAAIDAATGRNEGKGGK